MDVKVRKVIFTFVISEAPVFASMGTIDILFCNKTCGFLKAASFRKQRMWVQ